MPEQLFGFYQDIANFSILPLDKVYIFLGIESKE